MSGNVATYYDILRVGRSAGPEGVRTAYRRLAQQYHPDKLPDDADAARVMATLNEAYAVLSDPKLRASYDRQLEDASTHGVRAKRGASTPAALPVAAWPWYLLFATIAFAVAAVGTVLYKSLVPGAAAKVAPPAVQAHANSRPAPAAAKLTKP